MAISRALKDDIRGCAPQVDRAEVVYQGVQMGDFPYRPLPPPTDDQPMRILYVGQLSRPKGVHTVIEALALCRAPAQLLSLIHI